MIIKHHLDLGHNKLQVEKTDNIKKGKREKTSMKKYNKAGSKM